MSAVSAVVVFVPMLTEGKISGGSGILMDAVKSRGIAATEEGMVMWLDRMTGGLWRGLSRCCCYGHFAIGALLPNSEE